MIRNVFKLVGLTGSASFFVGWFSHEVFADRRHCRRRQDLDDRYWADVRRRQQQ